MLDGLVAHFAHDVLDHWLSDAHGAEGVSDSVQERVDTLERRVDLELVVEGLDEGLLMIDQLQLQLVLLESHAELIMRQIELMHLTSQIQTSILHQLMVKLDH